MTRIFSTRHLLAVALLLFLPLTHAAVPTLINFQGLVVDEKEGPLNGKHNMTFIIWSADLEGKALWTESHEGVLVTDGLFTVTLGSQGTPLKESVLDTPEAWLEVTVDSTIMSPRTQLTSTGYAHRISTIDGATAGTLNGNLTVDGSLQVGGQFAPTGGIIMPAGITIQSTGSNVLIIAGSSQITISPSGGVTIQSATVTINATDELTLSATNKVVIDAPWIDIHSTDSLDLRSDVDIQLTAVRSLYADAGAKIDASAGTSIDLTAGTILDLKSSFNMNLTASGILNLQGGGILDLNGGVVQIN